MVFNQSLIEPYKERRGPVELLQRFFFNLQTQPQLSYRFAPNRHQFFFGTISHDAEQAHREIIFMVWFQKTLQPAQCSTHIHAPSLRRNRDRPILSIPRHGRRFREFGATQRGGPREARAVRPRTDTAASASSVAPLGGGASQENQPDLSGPSVALSATPAAPAPPLPPTSARAPPAGTERASESPGRRPAPAAPRRVAHEAPGPGPSRKSQQPEGLGLSGPKTTESTARNTRAPTGARAAPDSDRGMDVPRVAGPESSGPGPAHTAGPRALGVNYTYFMPPRPAAGGR